jgi:hypothetical protein
MLSPFPDLSALWSQSRRAQLLSAWYKPALARLLPIYSLQTASQLSVAEGTGRCTAPSPAEHVCSWVLHSLQLSCPVCAKCPKASVFLHELQLDAVLVPH